MVLPEGVTVGQLVRSMVGRDKGKYYLIFEVLDEAFVRVIDGEKRKTKNPKRKNLKHLEILPVIADSIAEKIRGRERFKDEVITETIKQLGLSHKDS